MDEQNLDFNNRVPLDDLKNAVTAVKDELGKIIVGQENFIELLIIALLADGHVLIEGVPGIAKTITAQEAKLQKERLADIYIPEIAKDLVEQIGFEARDNPYVDHKSGISARMSITSYENLLSTAEYRCLQNNSMSTAIRFSDILGMIPSITGKVELVYEGEQEGANFVAEQLISAASKSLFDNYFPEIKKLKHEDEHDPYQEIVQWFFDESSFEIMDDSSEEEYATSLISIKPLGKLIKKYMPDLPEKDILFVKEFVLWALVEYNKLNKQRVKRGFEFKDPYGAFLSDLQ